MLNLLTLTRPAAKQPPAESQPRSKSLQFGSRKPDLLDIENKAASRFTNPSAIKKFTPATVEEIVHRTLESRDPSVQEALKELRGKHRAADRPRLFAQALRPAFAELAERARAGEDIHLASEESTVKSLLAAFQEKGITAAVDKLSMSATLLRLQDEFSDVFKIMHTNGTVFTTKNFMEGLNEAEVAWEILKAHVRHSQPGDQLMSINNFLKTYDWKKTVTEVRYIVRDLYNRLLEQEYIAPLNEAEQVVWQDDSKGPKERN